MRRSAVTLFVALLLARAAFGGDFFAESGDGTQTYYEALQASEPSAFSSLTAEGQYPETLHVERYDQARVVYVRIGAGFEIEVLDYSLHHERLDVVYQVTVLAVIPRDADVPEEIGPEWTLSGEPLLYCGAPIRYKRAPAMESDWLPNLVIQGVLEDLSETPYAWRAFTTVISWCSTFGEILEGVLRVEYTSRTPPPDPNDDRFAMYLVTAIPGLDPRFPAFSVRVDVEPLKDAPAEPVVGVPPTLAQRDRNTD